MSLTSRADFILRTRFALWLLAGVSGVFFFSSISDELRTAEERNWILTNASITEQKTLKNCNKGAAFTVVLFYSFRLSSGSVAGGSTALPYNDCADEALAQSILAQNPIGSSIAVRVDPSNPARNRVDAEIAADDSSTHMLFFGLTFGALLLGQVAPVRRFFSINR
jgi:hypothetical protein